MKRFLTSGLAALVGVFLVVILAGIWLIKMGLIPINADAAPSSFENNFFPMVLHASVARRSSEQLPVAAPTDEGIMAGAEIYKGMCAQCHGQLNLRPSVLGASFYPPAPQLPGHGTSYTEAEVFWIVKHGIRNTAMPAGRNLLSDEDIRQVAAFVKTLDSEARAGEASKN